MIFTIDITNTNILLGNATTLSAHVQDLPVLTNVTGHYQVLLIDFRKTTKSTILND